MNDALVLVSAGIAGVGLGAIFFAGLWWTVRKGIHMKRPALWFLGSLLLRTSITLAGFYFVSGSHWDRMTACLGGFLLARVAVTRMTAPEAKHAP